MKTKMEIRAEIRKNESLLQSLKDKYSRMGQMDMQSGDGSQMRGAMNHVQGIIEGLTWTLNDGVDKAGDGTN